MEVSKKMCIFALKRPERTNITEVIIILFKMKKLVYLVVACVAISFAACNGCNEGAEVTADTLANDSVLVDTLVPDSVLVDTFFVADSI